MITKFWQSHQEKIDVQGQEQVLKHFAADIKQWGASLTRESVIAELNQRSIDVSIPSVL